MTNAVQGFLLIGLVALIAGPAVAQPETPKCGEDAKAAITQARQALADEDADLRSAVVCLLAGLEAADRRVDDLIEGKTSFEGPVKAPSFLHVREKDEAQ